MPTPSSQASSRGHAPAGATIVDAAGIGPTLVVQEAGSLVRVPLGPSPVLLGRDASCDVRLTSRFVSAHHARVEPDGSGHRIVDLGSTNGLRREGQRLPKGSVTSLSHGDVLRIGDLSTGAFVTLAYENTESRESTVAAIVRRYSLTQNRPIITIGRAGADVELHSPLVSRHHAAIARVGDRHVLSDLGSINGTFVNGRRVTRVTLDPGAVIQIGRFRMTYDGQALSLADHRGSIRLDGIALTQEVSRGRVILRDASISIAPRELVALVGGSGAGKSTLMKALAGYLPASRGQVLVNGDDFYEHLDAYRPLLGYVPQDDTLHRELPVESALTYTARLRLPSDTSGAEIDARIARALEDVDMLAHKGKLIANLSGGQRKRVSIAAELLADPMLFFLDEPTSGLDPGLEKRMMYTLRNLADGGRTIVLVTHATANITQCDHVAFLAGGRIVFFGPPADALAFFNVESGDFADIYGKLEGSSDPSDRAGSAIAESDLAAELAAHRARNGGEAPSLAALWEMRFRASPYYASFVGKRIAEMPAPPTRARRRDSVGRRSGISALRQFFVLMFRYLHLHIQDKKNLLILLAQAPIIAYLTTLVARSDAIVGAKAFSPDAKTVIFMLSTIAVWFGIINAAREITKESAVYHRERLAGLSILSYVLSKVVVLTLIVLAQSAALVAIVTDWVRLPKNGVFGPAIYEIFGTTVLTSIAGLSLGLTISASARTPDRAISFVPLALIPQILFSGVLFSFGKGYSTTRILSWLTISRWSTDAYGATINLNKIPPIERLDEYAFNAQNLGTKWGILGGYAFGCLVLSCILLALRDRDR